MEIVKFNRLDTSIKLQLGREVKSSCLACYMKKINIVYKLGRDVTIYNVPNRCLGIYMLKYI